MTPELIQAHAPAFVERNRDKAALAAYKELHRLSASETDAIEQEVKRRNSGAETPAVEQLNPLGEAGGALTQVSAEPSAITETASVESITKPADILPELIRLKIPIFPLQPKSKVPPIGFMNWEDRATFDLQQIEAWKRQYPADSNWACVGKAEPGGIWILERDHPDAAKIIEQETGQKLPDTFRVQSSPGRFHDYFRHTSASLAMGNIKIACKDVGLEGGEFLSARGRNAYTVAPFSIHPKTGRPYEIVMDGQVNEAPQWLVDWLSKHKKSGSSGSQDAPKNETKAPVVLTAEEQSAQADRLKLMVQNYINDPERILRGTHDDTIFRIACALKKEGMELDDLEEAMVQIGEARLDNPGKDWEDMCRKKARSAMRYQEESTAAYVGNTLAQAEIAKAQATVEPPIEDAQINPDEETYDTGVNIDSFDGLPISALASTRLQDIYGEWFISPFGGYDWPLAFALPALVTAASVLVPPSPLVLADFTHLYTGLIGPFGCGKSQVLEWACRAIGIHSSPGHYYEIKFGSAEQLMKEMSTQQKNKRFDSTKACLINPDEWADMLVKAGIQDSGFPTFLTTAFNRRQHAKSVGGQSGGKTFHLDLAMSIAGGIIEDAFGDAFGASTLGGLYDRFLFGRAPQGFKWDYIECPIPDKQHFTGWNLKPVTVEPSVYEATKDWARQIPELGRVSEVCIRVAKIYACLDGRPEISGKDMEPLKPLALYQKTIRQRFRPNPGQNPDALYANEVIDWINQHAKEWTSVAKLKQRNWRLERKYGPTVADRALLSLARSGRVDLWLPGPDVSLPADYHGPNVKFKKGLVRRVK